VVALYSFMRLMGYPAERISLLTTYNGQKDLLRDVVEARCARHPLIGRPHKVGGVLAWRGVALAWAWAWVQTLGVAHRGWRGGDRGEVTERVRVDVAGRGSRCLMHTDPSVPLLTPPRSARVTKHTTNLIPCTHHTTPHHTTPHHTTQITTVDKYQGQQNDYVLLSLVRSRFVGHLRDVRRLVVALSR
jgi:hypothetical protein